MSEVKHDNMENVSTKVNAEFKALFEGLCQQMGLKPYNVLQLCAEAIVLMRDEEHNLSDDMRRIIRMFEGIYDCANRICLADNRDEFEVVGAIYLLRNKDKAGNRMVLVEPLFGEMNATYNTNTIVEKVLHIVSPSLYRLLLEIGDDMQTSSMVDTIHRVVDLYRENPMEQEVLDMFGDTRRMENGRQMSSGPYKRTMTNSMEAFERRQTSLWDDPDEIIKEVF